MKNHNKRRMKMNIIIVTKKGNILKFDSEAVRVTSRGGKGMRAIRLEEGDEVAGCFVETPKKNGK